MERKAGWRELARFWQDVAGQQDVLRHPRRHRADEHRRLHRGPANRNVGGGVSRVLVLASGWRVRLP